MSTSKLAVYSSLVLGLALAAGAIAAGLPEPGTVVTLASVEKVLGGKFKSETVEPGVVSFSETEGGYRSVIVFVSEGDGRKLGGIKDQVTQDGEPNEEIAGLEESMYRPQRGEASAALKDQSGSPFLLAIEVHNADSAEATKRFAIDLLKRAAVQP
jgi:hypothetical protein